MILLTAKGPYELRSVVFSHGWSDLAPFYVVKTDGTVRVGIRSGKDAIDVTVSPAKNGMAVQAGKPLADGTKKTLRRMFRLDEDLSPFYAHAGKTGRAWIRRARMGRFLRSQTVFEDLVKLILTTNCSWGLTRAMTDALARELGEATSGGLKLFPTADALASKSESFYRTKIRAGYRAPHLPKLARPVLEGVLRPETWEDRSRSTEEIREEILSVPGAGPYVAENLLRLLGRFENLGLDSWARGKLKEIWRMKKTPSDRTIAKHYHAHGAYRGLVLWCDLTRDWFKEGALEDWIRTGNRLPAN